jgi:hypothetical protein
MKTARLISLAAAIAAGVGLLSPGGASYAGWYDAVEISNAAVTSGELMVEEDGTSVKVANDEVVIEVSSQLHIAGDALTADLSLDLGGITPATGPQPSVQISTTPGNSKISNSSGPWRVNETDDGVRVTARIKLPGEVAKSLPRQTQVNWELKQTSSGRGWYSRADHLVSFTGLWPTVPPFPRFACTPSAGNLITIAWAWTDEEPKYWEIVRWNSAGNNPAIIEKIPADGRAIYSTTIDTQNQNWLYSVRGVYENGARDANPVTRSCAGAK